MFGIRIKGEERLRNSVNYKNMKAEFHANPEFRGVVKKVLEYAAESGKKAVEVGYLIQYPMETVTSIINNDYVGIMPFGDHAVFVSAYNTWHNVPFTCVYVCDETSQFLKDVRAGVIA